jgi:ABC-type transport system substrate-binding protein
MIPPAPRLKPDLPQSLSKRLWAAASAAASAAAVAAAAWAGSAPALALDVKASSVKLASAYDPQTFDPHALALLYHTRITLQIYESLVTRDAQYRIETALALSWTNPSPTVWRFQLRAGVTFHDGSPFTADDAAFSIERALGPNSRRSFQLDGVKAARRIDPLTVDVQLAAPNVVFPEKLWLIGMMSKRWSEQYGALPQPRTRSFDCSRSKRSGPHPSQGPGDHGPAPGHRRPADAAPVPQNRDLGDGQAGKCRPVAQRFGRSSLLAHSGPLSRLHPA